MIGSRLGFKKEMSIITEFTEAEESRTHGVLRKQRGKELNNGNPITVRSDITDSQCLVVQLPLSMELSGIHELALTRKG